MRSTTLMMMLVVAAWPICSVAAAIGPAAPGSVTAVYDQATGGIYVSAESVMNWFIEAADRSQVMVGPDDAEGVLSGIGGGIVSDNHHRIGDSDFDACFSYTDVYLGTVALAGLQPGDLVLRWNTGYGAATQQADVSVIVAPEGTVFPDYSPPVDPSPHVAVTYAIPETGTGEPTSDLLLTRTTDTVLIGQPLMPEPTTLALLGLGSLVALRRRRAA